MKPKFSTAIPHHRLHLQICGIVQGVGFRPFVYRLATELGLTGWANNTAEGVFVEVEGSHAAIEQFCDRLVTELPPHACIEQLHRRWDEPAGYKLFEIRHSERQPQRKTALVLPDLATCPQCLQELFDPSNRRYRYPFINCTHCGPRYSIVHTLPYDRPLTTMRDFPLCDRCQHEYDDPGDRRFHAQPNACPDCGPVLELWQNDGTVLARGEDALQQAETALRQGQIVALKGLGGFQLLVNACDADAVARLRQRKHRPQKPLAVMYPHLDAVVRDCNLGELEMDLLRSPAAPIVLLSRKAPLHPTIAANVAPDNPYLGVMVPYTPVHHLLLADLGFPVVATSGNLSGEPICIDNEDAVQRLGHIADVLLVHNRPIARPVDDSVVRIIANSPIVLRRARGYTPLTLSRVSSLYETRETSATWTFATSLPATLAVGGYLKNTVAIAFEQKALLSQHIGDLDNIRTREAFEYTLSKLRSIYDFEPEVVVCDAHPNYPSTQFAEAFAQERQLPLLRVQHHYAHVLSVVAEHQLNTPILGVAWDGTGFGDDGTAWGGEFLLLNQARGFQRVAHFRTFSLPGGDRAAKEPRRAALGLLYEVFGDEAFAMTELAPMQGFSQVERRLLQRALQRQINTPRTSSVGRLFDAIASLLGLCQSLSFEGQGGMMLEFAARRVFTTAAYPLACTSGVLDWQPMLREILADRNGGESVNIIAAKFHNTLIEAIAGIAQSVTPSLSNQNVVLSGGCFQNHILLEGAIARLQNCGISVFWNQKIPANDGGLALGQLQAVLRELG